MAMYIKLPQEVRFLLSTLLNKGFQAYIVGGCVRDSLMEIVPNDWDITTSATPTEIAECFNNLHIIDTGVKFGTLGVIVNNKCYEITTYRKDDVSFDNRHPACVSFSTSLNVDLSRRDFTINAIAYNPEHGLIDIFDGISDIASKRIKCVGTPFKRFEEDALRIMRALRFSSKLNFEIECQTSKAMRIQKHLLHNIASERIKDELVGILLGIGAKNVLKTHVDIISELIPEIIPTISFNQNNPDRTLTLWEHTVESISQSRNNDILRLALLFHNIAKPNLCTQNADTIAHCYKCAQASSVICETVLKRLKFDSLTISKASLLVNLSDSEIIPTRASVKRMLNKIGTQNFETLLNMKEADIKAQAPALQFSTLHSIVLIRDIFKELLEENCCFKLKDLAINGSDLIRDLNLCPGAQIGFILNHLMDMVLDESIKNEYQSLLLEAKNFISEKS